MFNRKFKLIAPAIGLVAVLMMGLALPGVTQQNPLSRANVVNAISNAVAATLTAAEGDILDIDNVVFYTDADVTLAYIPLHPNSRSLQLLRDLYDGKKVGSVTVGAVYLDNDWGLLKAGVYTLKAKDKFINDDKTLGYEFVALDQDGNEILCGCAIPRVTTQRMLPPTLPMGSLLDFTAYRRGILGHAAATIEGANPKINPAVIIAIAILIRVLSDEAQEWYQEINNSKCNKCPCDP